jgi:hypothetical protein
MLERTRGPSMKTLAAILLVVSWSVGSFAGQSRGNVQKDFDTLLARVKQSDDSVDFAQLRRLYSQTASYSPYGDLSKKEMYQALERNAFEEAGEFADKALKDNYLNIDAQLVKMTSCDKLQNSTCYSHHKYVAKGIIDSILESGDGKSAKTAWFVISVAEEYAVARVLGLRVVSQALSHAEGHSYDILTVVDSETKEESILYFNIDVIFSAERRLFEKKGL